jgi:hypothetical protein
MPLILAEELEHGLPCLHSLHVKNLASALVFL